MEVDTTPVDTTHNGVASPTGSSESLHLEGEALEQAILKQVDYYFSRQNLSNDAFLVSQMNQQLWVSISVIAKFRAVAKLTSDEALIAKVMKNSKVVAVDETGSMLKPNITNVRNTIILRDIPASTTPEQIRDIFENKSNFSDRVESVRPDVGGTWFVTFQGEPEALRALEFLRGETFNGAGIKARIKSENLLRQFYNPNDGGPTSPSAGAPGYNPGQNPYYGGQQYQYYPYDPNYMQQYDYRGDYRNQRGGFRGGKAARGGARDMQQRRPSPGNVPVPMQQGVAMVGMPVADRGGRGGRPRKNSARKVPEKGPDGTVVPGRSSVQLGPAHFPPLPSKTMADSIGYGDMPFTRYSREEALRIMDDMAEAMTKPAFHAPNCPVVLAEANVNIEAGKDKEDMEAERQRKDSNISTDGEYDEAEGMATILAGENPASLTAIPEAQAPKGFAAVVKSGNQTPSLKKPAPVTAPSRPASAPNAKKNENPGKGKEGGSSNRKPASSEGSRPAKSGDAKEKAAAASESNSNKEQQQAAAPAEKEDPNKPPSYAAMLKKKQAEQAAAASAAAAPVKAENGKNAEK